MDSPLAMRAFAALSQTTRLKAFRLLIEHGPVGLRAGKLAEKLKVPANTLSSHLRALQNAGLIASQRDSRQIVYRALPSQIHALAEFLLKNCCHADKKRRMTHQRKSHEC